MRPFKNLFFVLAFFTSIGLTECKNKSNKNTTNTTADTATTTTAPVEIETDDVLKNGVKDATKDFPGVNASVENGEITLTGEIKRDNLSKLMQSLNTLHPKKINNNLTIK